MGPRKGLTAIRSPIGCQPTTVVAWRVKRKGPEVVPILPDGVGKHVIALGLKLKNLFIIAELATVSCKLLAITTNNFASQVLLATPHPPPIECADARPAGSPRRG